MSDSLCSTENEERCEEKKMLGDSKFEMLSLCTKLDAYIAFSLSEHIFLYESILALGC